jgi:hypothetical protein
MAVIAVTRMWQRVSSWNVNFKELVDAAGDAVEDSA